MDSLLEIKLENIKDIILNYLFVEEDKYKWNTNQKVKININFKPLLQGNWTREWRNMNTNINLDNLLNTKICKEDFFQILENELIREKKTGDYSSNFNPNLFFLFFDYFYYNMKNKDKILHFEADVDHNDTIIGIRFNNDKKISKIYRPEFLKIIEIHSRFLLNNTILDILKVELFTKYFIKNCYIQYEVKINFLNQKNFVDLCYLIEDKELFLEINELWHDKINDHFRELNILLSTGSRLVNFNLGDTFCTNEKVFDNLFLNFCKLLYQSEESKAIILILVEVNGFPLEQVELGVGLLNKEIQIKLSELLNISFLDDINLNIDEFIEKVFNNENINKELDFINFTKKLTLKNLLKYKNEIKLTSYGVKNFLLTLTGKEWKKRKEYIKFMDDLEYKYYETIKNLLEDNSFDILKNENLELKNILILNKFDQNEFYNKIKRNEKLYHPRIPFIIKQDKSFVNYKLLANILKNIKIKETDIKNNIIVNYRLMTFNEIHILYNDEFL